MGNPEIIVTPEDRIISEETPGSIEIRESSVNGNEIIVTDKEALREQIDSITSYKKFFVIGVAGQSNAVGYDESPLTKRNVSKNKKRILQLGAYGSDNLKLIPLDHCAQNIQDLRTWANKNNKPTVLHGTKGLHLPLCNLLLDYIPDDYAIVVIPVAHGETGFTVSSRTLGEFDPGTKLPTGYETDRTTNRNQVRYNWGHDSAYSKTLIERIKHVMSLGTAEDNIFGGIIWIQGEADNAKPGDHKTKFIQMADNILSTLNTAIGEKTARKTIDRNMWFNVETTIYWNSMSGVRTIWNNYKEFSPNSYVSVLQAAHITNRKTKSTATSSTMDAHYGGDAYSDYVAPAILNKMLEQGVLNFGSHHSLKNSDGFREIEPKDYVKKTRNAYDLSSYLKDTLFIGTGENAPGFWLDDSIEAIEFELGEEMTRSAGVLVIVGDDGFTEAHTSIFFGKGTTSSNNKLFYGATTSISFTVMSSYNTGLNFLSSPVADGKKIRIEKISNTSIRVTVGEESGIIDFADSSKSGPANVFTECKNARIRFGFSTHYTTNGPVHLKNIKVKDNIGVKTLTLFNNDGLLTKLLYRLNLLDNNLKFNSIIEHVSGFGVNPVNDYVYSNLNGIISTFTNSNAFTFTRDRSKDIVKSVFRYGEALPNQFIGNLPRIPLLNNKYDGITIHIACRLTEWYTNYATPGLFSILNETMESSILSIGIDKAQSESSSLYKLSKKIEAGSLTPMTTAKGTIHEMAFISIVFKNSGNNLKVKYYVNGESVNDEETINNKTLSNVGGVMIGGALGFMGTSAEFKNVFIQDIPLEESDVVKFYNFFK